MNIINGIKEGLLKAEFAMSSAMESANNEILHVQNEDDKNSISISQHVATKSVYEALLRGEITQEVIDFRYHLYLLSAKIDDYRGILNEDGSARVERVVVDKPLYVEENDMGYETVLIQGIKTIDLDDDINVLNSYMSGCKPDNRISTLAITRKFKPIYKTEIWAKRVVLKKNSDGEINKYKASGLTGKILFFQRLFKFCLKFLMFFLYLLCQINVEYNFNTYV